jgi:ferrochelatase
MSASPRPAPRKLAIVLFNLGGPDRPEAVRPFLENLFTDPAILRVPGFIRPLLGKFIAARRTKAASENYAIIGGKSPLLELTVAQAQALEAALARETPVGKMPGGEMPGEEVPGGQANIRCFVAMRYWHPFADAAAKQVRDWGAEEVLLLPLYPQYSTTTTGSSVEDWMAACARIGMDLPTRTLCCWHSDNGFARATAAIVRRAYDEARAALPAATRLRILFSAHGLPESIVKAGDPYQWQVEQSVGAIIHHLGIEELDHGICYQSRVTPQKWIGPSTEVALEQAAKDGVAVLVHPVAFVSEHSETLVELDVEYKELAHKLGLKGYFRVPAQNSDPAFIGALAELVRRAQNGGRTLCSFAGARQCPKVHGDCPHAKAPRQQQAAA